MRLIHLPRYFFGALFGVLFFITTAAAQINETEPNNTPATAQALILGATYVGKISSGTPADTADFFRLSLANSGNVALRLKPQTPGTDSYSSWRVGVWDYATNKNLLSFIVTPAEQTAAAINIGLAAGNFYISVTTNQGRVTDIPYLLTATFAAGNSYEQELNDSPDGAQPINFGTEYVGRIQGRAAPAPPEFDYYKFAITNPSNLTLRFKPQTPGADYYSGWRVSLKDYATDKELLSLVATAGDPAGRTVSVGLTTGSYYIRVESGTGVVLNVSYLLTATLVVGNAFEQEFNDSPATAQPINFSTDYVANLQNRPSSSAEFDYFKFSLASRSNIALRLRPQTGSEVDFYSRWRVRLRDYATDSELLNFNVYAYDLVGATNRISLPPGSYYISIDASTGNTATVPYVLTVTPSVPMVEFIHTALNYYFVTASPTEIALLDTMPAFVRTGESFQVYPTFVLGTHGINRFYFDRIAAKELRGSHFYTLVDSEIAAMAALNPSNSADSKLPFNEGVNSFAFVPGPTGLCATGQRPVYRLFRGNINFPDDPNHRFTTSLTTYNNLIALGWDGEGVKFCAPTL